MVITEAQLDDCIEIIQNVLKSLPNLKKEDIPKEYKPGKLLAHHVDGLLGGKEDYTSDDEREHMHDC